MAELKPGWQRVKFGDVVRLSKERCADPVAAGIERYIGLEHLEPGDLRVRSWGDVADGTTFTTRVRPGQVLFGKRRAYQRKVAVADFDAVCSGDIYVFESADPNRLLPDLLPFLCMTDAFFDHAVGTSAGSLSPRTNWTSLAGYEFSLPPREEQLRVLPLLNSASNVVLAARAQTIALRIVDSAFLSESFPADKRRSLIATIPLHKLASVKLGYKVSPVHRGERTSKPVLTVAQIQDGYFDLTNVREVTIPVHMVAGFRPERGSLLVTEGGNIDQLGRGAIWGGEISDCIFQNHVFSITPHQEMALPEYLEGLMRSPQGREYFLRYAKRTSNLATIDQNKVRMMPVPVISMAEQEAWCIQYKSIRAGLSECVLREAASLKLLATASVATLGRTP